MNIEPQTSMTCNCIKFSVYNEPVQYRFYWTLGGALDLNSKDELVEDLVRLAQSGDQSAVSRLIQAYHRHVYQTAWNILRSKHDAEEVAQDTFIHMYRKIQTLHEPRAFHSWLTTITTRLAIDLARRNKRRYADPLETIENTRLSHESDPAAQAMIEEALNRLSPSHRAVLLLRERDGYEYAEIAQILQVPIGTVKSRLAYARQALIHFDLRKGDPHNES